MSRSKLGPLPDSVFEDDLWVPDMKALEARYSDEHKQFIDKLKQRVGRSMTAARKKKKQGTGS